jgi:hypothetical protein
MELWRRGEESRAEAAGEMRMRAERRDLVEPQEQVPARSGGLGGDEAGAGPYSWRA